MHTSKKSIRALLTAPSSPFHDLLERAAQLALLTRQLQSFLSPPYNCHCVVTNIRGETLVIGADNANWLTQVRYHAPAILNFMRTQAGITQLTKIHFKVTPSSPQPVALNNRRPTISPQASAQIKAAANCLDHPKLRNTLLRLASRSSS